MSQTISVKLCIMRGKDVLHDETRTIRLSDTVLSFKETIQAAYGYAADSQRLHAGGPAMDDDKTFAFYGVQNGQKMWDLLMP